MKDKKREIIRIILVSIVIVIFIGSIIFMLMNSLRNTITTIIQEFCEDSGGEWNFYEFYNAPLLTPTCNTCNERKTGNWCDYPDGTSKSEEDIEKMINSTTSFYTDVRREK